MARPTQPTIDHLIATDDPPPTGIANPIHDAEGADGAGYSGALVAGVRTYGWAAQTVARALGSEWLNSGWVDYSLRRPLFAGEEVEITVAPADSTDGTDAGFSTINVVGRGQGGDRVVLDGTAGLGLAPWFDDITPPAPTPGKEAPAVRPTYDLDSIPTGQPLRPLSVYLKAEAATRLVTDDLGIDDDPRYTKADPPFIQPYFLAGRMAPLTRHNFTYGPTIHVRSQIQHRGEARSAQSITVGAQIVDSYDRNDHWYQILDGVVTGESGAELARIRHHTIFRPRGTTMPEPIVSTTGR